MKLERVRDLEKKFTLEDAKRIKSITRMARSDSGEADESEGPKADLGTLDREILIRHEYINDIDT